MRSGIAYGFAAAAEASRGVVSKRRCAVTAIGLVTPSQSAMSTGRDRCKPRTTVRSRQPRHRPTCRIKKQAIGDAHANWCQNWLTKSGAAKLQTLAELPNATSRWPAPGRQATDECHHASIT